MSCPYLLYHVKRRLTHEHTTGEQGTLVTASPAAGMWLWDEYNNKTSLNKMLGRKTGVVPKQEGEKQEWVQNKTNHGWGVEKQINKRKRREGVPKKKPTTGEVVQKKRGGDTGKSRGTSGR